MARRTCLAVCAVDQLLRHGELAPLELTRLVGLLERVLDLSILGCRNLHGHGDRDRARLDSSEETMLPLLEKLDHASNILHGQVRLSGDLPFRVAPQFHSFDIV